MKKNYQHIEASEMVMQELRRFKRACRLQSMCDLLNVGLVLAIVLVLIAIILKMVFNTLHIPLPVFLICPMLLFILSLLKPVKMKELALQIDDRLKMKERLTTSLDFMEEQNSYTALLFHDTLKRLKGVRPQSLFPVKLSRVISLSALLCGMLLFYSFSNFTKEGSSRKINVSSDVKLSMQKEGERLKKLADKFRTSSLAGEALDKEVIHKLEKLSEGLQSDNIDKHDALLMLTDTSESLKGLHLKETGSPEDLLNHVDKEQAIAEEKIADSIEETFNEVLNSIDSAKKNIAEADIEAIKEETRETPGKGSDTKNLSSGKSVSGVTGEAGGPVLPGDLSVSKNGSSRDARTSGLNDGIYPAKNLEFPAENIILKYQDSVIPLGSLPRKYHKIIKDYFDAVSGG